MAHERQVRVADWRSCRKGGDGRCFVLCLYFWGKGGGVRETQERPKRKPREIARGTVLWTCRARCLLQRGAAA